MTVKLLDASGREIPAGEIARARARAAVGAYLAASSEAPELRDWTPPTVSPDAELEGERQDIVDRARDLQRNDALVAGALQQLKDSSVAFGLRLQSTPDYRRLGITRGQARAKAEEIEAIWREWSEDPLACDVAGQSDFGRQTRQGINSDLVAGESLALVHWLPQRQARFGSRFATVLQMVAPDRLSNPMDRPSTETLRDGVEIDEYGAPIAYHLRSTHPGDMAISWAAAAATWERVPLRGPMGRRRVLHSFDKRAEDQHRGISILAPVMTELKQRARYQRAELQAAVVNAVIAAVLETPADGQTLLELFGEGSAYLQQRTVAPQVQLGIGPGGAIPRLFPGESLKGYSAGRPSNAFDGFMTSVCRLGAVGLNMTYETFVRDFSKTNYSSARASMMEAWRYVLFLRMLKTLTWAKPALELVIEEAVWRGYIDLPDFETSRAARLAWLRGLWLGPPRGWIDPVKEIQAAAMRVRLGISTLRDEALEQGRDLDELLDQIALEREALEARGIALPEIGFTPVAERDAPEE